MKIKEFIKTYCSDMVKSYSNNKKLVDWTTLPYQEMGEDTDGNPTPVVYIDGEQVPVKDFVAYDKTDFVSIHKMPSAGEIYDNYISSLVILEGADVINQYRDRMKKEAEQIKNDIDTYALIV